MPVAWEKCFDVGILPSRVLQVLVQYEKGKLVADATMRLEVVFISINSISLGWTLFKNLTHFITINDIAGYNLQKQDRFNNAYLDKPKTVWQNSRPNSAYWKHW